MPVRLILEAGNSRQAGIVASQAGTSFMTSHAGMVFLRSLIQTTIKYLNSQERRWQLPGKLSSFFILCYISLNSYLWEKERVTEMWLCCWMVPKFPFYVVLILFVVPLRDYKFHEHPGETDSAVKEGRKCISWTTHGVPSYLINKAKMISLNPCFLCLCLNINTYVAGPWVRTHGGNFPHSATSVQSPRSCNPPMKREKTRIQSLLLQVMIEHLWHTDSVIQEGDSHAEGNR